MRAATVMQRTWVSLGLVLLACGGDGPSEPEAPPVTMALVSGDAQEGTAGELLRHPLVVRVTDAAGAGVPGVEVAWEVTSGAGGFGRFGQTARSTYTGANGATRVRFRPTALGTNTVTAQVGGLEGSPVRFTTEVTAVLIRLGPECLEYGEAGFVGPDGTSDVGAEPGMTVRWALRPCRAHVRSSSVPPGGEHFDSGLVSFQGTFEFVPGVPGTWEYVDEVSGATGTLTVE